MVVIYVPLKSWSELSCRSSHYVSILFGFHGTGQINCLKYHGGCLSPNPVSLRSPFWRRRPLAACTLSGLAGRHGARVSAKIAPWSAEPPLRPAEEHRVRKPRRAARRGRAAVLRPHAAGAQGRAQRATPNGCMVDLMARAEGWTDACAHREHVEAVVCSSGAC
jgi:hypothetical protein